MRDGGREMERLNRKLLLPEESLRTFGHFAEFRLAVNEGQVREIPSSLAGDDETSDAEKSLVVRGYV